MATTSVAGELNDASGGEDGLAIYGSGNPDFEIGTWLDDRAGAGNTDFVVEYPTTCPAALNGDNAVDSSDLLVLLAFWGDCPLKCLGGYRRGPHDRLQRSPSPAGVVGACARSE